MKIEIDLKHLGAILTFKPTTTRWRNQDMPYHMANLFGAILGWFVVEFALFGLLIKSWGVIVRREISISSKITVKGRNSYWWLALLIPLDLILVAGTLEEIPNNPMPMLISMALALIIYYKKSNKAKGLRGV